MKWPWQVWVALALLQIVFFVLGYIQGRWLLWWAP